MASVNDIIVKLRVDDKDVDVRLDEFAGHLRKIEQKGNQSGKSIGEVFSSIKAGYIAAAAAVAGIISIMKGAIDAASNYQESNSKMLAVFDQMPDSARKVRDELHDMYFMSYNDATKLLGATGDVLQGMEMQQQASLDLAAATVKLAADRASFTNAEGGAEAIAKALTSAYVGEREALKTYGIVITEADVQTGLLEKGQNKLTGAALKAAKAQITYELALKQSDKSVGDLQRTQDSYANTQRRLAAATDDISVKFGAVFLPIATKVLEWGAELVNSIDVGAVAGVFLATYEVIKDFAIRAGKLLFGMGQIMLGVLNPAQHSASIAAGWADLSSALADNWDDLIKNIALSIQEGEKMVSEFMEGSAVEQQKKAKENQQKLTEQQRVELQKRQDYEFKSHRLSLEEYSKILDERIEYAKGKYSEDSIEYMQALDAKKEAEQEYFEEQQKIREQFYEFEQENREFIKEMRQEDTDEYLEQLEAQVDREYELGEISYTQYIALLNKRMAYAAVMYGKESVEYQRMEDQKKLVQKQALDAQLAAMDVAFGSISTIITNMFGKSKKAAIAGAIIDTIAASVRAFYNAGGWPMGLLPMAASLSAGYAKVNAIRRQKFRRGGFTGYGDPNQKAGDVEYQEYVINEQKTKEYRRSGLLGALEMDRLGMSPMQKITPQIVAAQQPKNIMENKINESIGELSDTLKNLKFSANIDKMGLSLVVESGNKNLSDLEF